MNYLLEKFNMDKITAKHSNKPLHLQKATALERKEIIDWAKSELVNKGVTVSRSELKGHISFTNKGIKEALNQPHNNYHAKNQAIKNIVELLENSIYAGSAEDVKARRLKFHYFKTIIKEDDSFIVIKEGYDNTFRFYSIVDRIK